jgi:drug/metabolite transporter (DMT)-like permease
MLLTITLLSIATLFAWGLSDYLAGRSGKQMNHYVANFLFQGVGLVLLAPFVMYYGLSVSSLGDVLVMIVSAGLLTLAFAYFIRAMAEGPAGVAAPIANSYSAVTLVLSLLFFNVMLSGKAIAALVLVIFGAVLLSSDKQLFRGKWLHLKTVKLALVPLAAWGVGFALLNLVVENNDWHETLFVVTAAMAAFAAVAMLLVAPKKDREFKAVFSLKHKTPLIAGTIGIAGAVAFFSAGDLAGNFVVPAVLASVSPLVTSYLAFLFDKERLSLLNRLGAVLAVAGIALLNL